jgi:hypothetical protein
VISGKFSAINTFFSCRRARYLKEMRRPLEEVRPRGPAIDRAANLGDHIWEGGDSAHCTLDAHFDGFGLLGFSPLE